ncbi:CRISPR-associated protein (Cas_Cas02710) [uncultured archaeon]|nr:CRISPR-associated protein (Cas_Cas02710) [uncultured archaeon]
MTQLIPYLRSRWDELLITGIYLNSIVASIFTGNVQVALGVTLGGLVFLAIIFKLMTLYRRRLPMHGDNVAFKVPRRGLIFTVGRQMDTIRMALQMRKPEFIAFICSMETESDAIRLAEDFGYDKAHYKKEVVDPYNVKEIRTKTEVVLDWLLEKDLKTTDVAADITGGTTTMSVGVFSMTEDRMVDSQYIRSQFDEQNKRIDGTQEAVFVSYYGRE